MLFPTIQKRLDQQEVTHKTASEFLQTLKTLMAKLKVGYQFFDEYESDLFFLKANDWGALSRKLTRVVWIFRLADNVILRKPCCTPCPSTLGYASKSYLTWQ